ncbi:SIS domain-containing protein, partial [Pseudomonas syringae group genomosp. 7]|uniref:SIS domain-containing protein n=1 Tax=Pseudomonas syringae group genomosp. 7 TaxID=251699 RepID=UPI00377042DF
ATAREGALKVKEIAYLAAEGLPAGELKHGPLALVEEGFPVALLATARSLARKCETAAAEIAARGGKVSLFSQYEEVLASSRAVYR